MNGYGRIRANQDPAILEAADRTVPWSKKRDWTAKPLGKSPAGRADDKKRKKS